MGQYQGGYQAVEVTLPASLVTRQAAVAPVQMKHGAAIVFNSTSRAFEIIGWSGKSSEFASTTAQTYYGATYVYSMNLLTKFLSTQSSPPVKIMVEDTHSAILTASGQIFSWSYNSFARAIGSDISNATVREVDPELVLGGRAIVQLSRAYADGVPRPDGLTLDVTYALASDGSLWRWGAQTSLKSPVRVPHSISGGNAIKKIYAGITVENINSRYDVMDFVFATTTSGQLFVFGRCTYQSTCFLSADNTYAALGLTPVIFQGVPTPSIVNLAIYGRGNLIGVLATDSVGRLWYWGRSPSYYFYDSTIPTLINATILTGVAPQPFFTNVWSSQVWMVDINAGSSSIFLQDSNGVVYSFGDNNLGSLCRSSVDPNPPLASPINSSALTGQRVREVVVGSQVSYLIMDQGSVFGCGRNDKGQLATLPFRICGQYEYGCKLDTPYPIPIIPTPSRPWNVSSFSVGESAFVLRTESGAIYAGGAAFAGSIFKKMDPDDAAEPLGFSYGRKFTAFSVGAGGSVVIAAPLEIIANSTQLISTVSLYVSFEGNGFASTTESVPVIALSNGIPCIIQSRSRGKITCLMTTDVTVRPPLVVGPLSATLTYGGETVGPVQIATVVAAPAMETSIAPLSERASFLTILGNGLGSDPASLAVVGCGPVVSVTSNSVTCQITEAISAEKPAMKVRVLRAADPALSSRFVSEVVVATVIREHEVTRSVGIVPSNSNKLKIEGRGFNSSADFSAVLSVDQGDSSPCNVTEITSTSFLCTFKALSSYRNFSTLSIHIYQAGYNASKVIGSLGREFDPSRLRSSRSTFASNTRTIELLGEGFGDATSFALSVSLISGYEQDRKKRAQAIFGCTILSRNDSMVECRPDEVLQPGPLIAELITDVGFSFTLPLGQVVAAPSVDASASFSKLATTATRLRIIGNGFASGNQTDQNSVIFTNFPQKVCNIVSVSNTTLTCDLAGLMFPTGLIVQASVSVYGGLAGQFPTAIVVNPPRVQSSTDKILKGSSVVIIRGDGFASETPSKTNVVTLQVDGGQPFLCVSQDALSNSSVITCSLENTTTTSLEVAGAISATVRAYGGSSEATIIGIVEVPVAPTSSVNIVNATTDVGIVAGAVVAVVVVLVAVGVVILVIVRRRMRMLKNIAGTTIDVPQEMAQLFNIKSTDLQIIRRLGEGSYGAVFLAKNAAGKMVAVKKLAGTMMASAASDFFREAALMVGIPPHRNVVRVFGLVQEVSNFSLVMEFLPNGALDAFAMKMIHTPGVSWDPIIQYRIVLGAARGMAHLAAQGIVHRDLAARNILLTAHCEPKISDFGMSRVVGSEAQAATKADVGPIRWMAPEGIRERLYSEKSDVFSFGVLLYEMVSGAEPYLDMELLQVAMAVRDQGLTVLSLLPPAGSNEDFVPEYIRRLIEQCSHQEPTSRPSFQEIVAWLEQCAPYGYADLPEDDDITNEVNRTNSKKKKHQNSAEPTYAPVEVLSN